MSKRKEIFKDAGIYAVSSYIAQAFDILNGILVRRFLGPTNMGIWSFLQIIQNYAKHAGLGVTTATSRDVPYYLGKGDTQKADQVKNLVFTFTVLTSIIAALIVVAIAFWNKNTYSKPIFFGLFVVAGLIVLQRIYNLYVVVIRSHKAFAFAGILNIASSILSLILTVVLTWKFQLTGFFASLILNYVLMIFFIRLKTPYQFSYYFNWKELLPLLSLGSVMVVSDILRSVVASIDRIMIAKYLGFEALGLYSIALMAGNYLYSFPNMLGIIFFPHLQETLAKRDNPQDLEKYLREPTLCLSYLFPILIGAAWILSEFIFPIILPKYAAGIPALKLYILGAFFIALTHPYINYIIAIKKHWQLIPLHIFFIAFGFLITWIFIKAGWGLPGVAVAAAILDFSEFLTLSLIAFSNMYRWNTALKLYAKVAVSFIYSTACLLVLDYYFKGKGGQLGWCLLELIIFGIAMIPFLWIAEKESHVLTTIKGVITDYRNKVKIKS